jgi:hypothetical protein
MSVFGMQPNLLWGDYPLLKDSYVMRTTYYGNRRGGHCPSHVRQAFIDALEAYTFWETGEPEPQVTFEVDFLRSGGSVSAKLQNRSGTAPISYHEARGAISRQLTPIVG